MVLYFRFIDSVIAFLYLIVSCFCFLVASLFEDFYSLPTRSGSTPLGLVALRFHLPALHAGLFTLKSRRDFGVIKAEFLLGFTTPNHLF